MITIFFITSLLCSFVSAEVIFHYNNTYKYGVTYTVFVNKTDEYILEFAGDNEIYNTPARVSVASTSANTTYPVFITARQQKGVLSWQLPMTVAASGRVEEFSSVSRTLCPHNNLFNQEDEVCDASTLNTPIVHLSTSSRDTIPIDIRVDTVHDFYVKLSEQMDHNGNLSHVNHTYNMTISPSQPMYFFYSFNQHSNLSLDVLDIQNKVACKRELTDFEQMKMDSLVRQSGSSDWLARRDGVIEARAVRPDRKDGGGWFWRPKSVILIIESTNDICAVVSIQNFSCPVFDNERDILYDGQYLTMTRAGGITLTEEQFPLGFYIVFIVKSSDEDCLEKNPSKAANTTSGLESYLNWHESESVELVTNDGRVKSFRFAVVSTISYYEYAVAAGLVLAFFLLFYVAFLVAACCCGRRAPAAAPVGEDNASFEEEPTAPVTDALLPERTSLAQLERSRRGNTASPVSSNEGSLDGSELSVLVEEEPEEGSSALPPRLCLASLATAKGRVLRARSNLYAWSVLTITVFYTLPVVQLVVTYQTLLNQSGNQDLCYYNFLCSHPLGLLSDFNHVYSNIGYVLLGALFLLQVYRRQRLHGGRHPEQNKMGIPQHYGLLYAMGIALVSEGLLSGSYHVCPNDMNFQFDTSFMYVTAVLSMVKIYQSRHPDINARAHATFGVLALIIFIGLVGVLDSSIYFWVLFTFVHISTCFILTFKIYYLGRFRFDGGLICRAMKELASTPLAAVTPTYCGRMVLLILANMVNWALAAYGMYQHQKDFASHLLVVIMSNLYLYTNFYVLMKVLSRERIRPHSWLFFVVSHATWYTAAYFFLQQSTSWALTPAQSRQYNRVCSLLQLYDPHDVWHMLSAVAMFLSFNMYLTIDDNLSATPHADIMVF